MKCIYCKQGNTYVLADKQRKCSQCKRKFSPKKIERNKKLFNAFYKGDNARAASKSLGMHFATVQKYYEKFRRDLALQSDQEYQLNAHLVTQYDEYLYLPKSLSASKNLHKMQHFLTMAYLDKVYNIMMPSVSVRHFDYGDTKKNKLLLKYFKFNKVAKLEESQGVVTQFWSYFEEFILQYKGGK